MYLIAKACIVAPVFGVLVLTSCTSPSANNSERLLYADRPQQALDKLGRDLEPSPPREGQLPPSLNGKVTPSELSAYALVHHPRVRAAHLEWGAAIRQIDASRRQPDAMLSWAESIYPVETRLGSIDRRFMLEQRFFNPWKLDAREGQATVMARRKRIAFIEVVQQVERDIGIAYANLQARQARVSVISEMIELLKGIEEIVEANIATNQATQAQLLRVQVERETTESQLAQEELRLRALQARLAEAVGYSGDLAVTPQDLLNQLPEQRSRSVLLAGALAHPLIALQNSLALLQDEKLKEAEAERLPDYTLALEYSMVGDRPGDVEDEGLDALAIRIGVTIPWHFSTYDAREEAITIQREAELAKADALALTLLRRVEDQLFLLEDAKREDDLYRKSVLPKAKQTLELSMKDFAVGRSTFIDVLDAERAVLAAELALVRVRQAVAKVQCELRYLSGHGVGSRDSSDNTKRD